jgi:hypothetical protein
MATARSRATGNIEQDRKLFNQWKAKVDAILSKKLGGLTSDDLPDIDYWSLWQDRVSPSSAAAQAIRNAKES